MNNSIFAIKDYKTCGYLRIGSILWLVGTRLYQVSKRMTHRLLVVMAGLDPAIQTPKASVWMPGSRPGMMRESITTGLGSTQFGGSVCVAENAAPRVEECSRKKENMG
jgi:hypothetical protein